jgi:hypothetical protein
MHCPRAHHTPERRARASRKALAADEHRLQLPGQCLLEASLQAHELGLSTDESRARGDLLRRAFVGRSLRCYLNGRDEAIPTPMRRLDETWRTHVVVQGHADLAQMRLEHRVPDVHLAPQRIQQLLLADEPLRTFR